MYFQKYGIKELQREHKKNGGNFMKTVLITGATSGIGEEFARRFAKRGYRLILAGRNREKLLELKELYGNDTMLICSDLAEEQNCYDLLEQVKSEKIDVFINNAGFGDCGRFTENDIEKEVKMIKVNDIAMHILFKGMLLKMEQRERGIILNVASSAGLLPAGPFMATYYASKAYAVSLTRAVAYELKAQNSKVYVCALCPGPVDTNFNEVAKVQFALPGISVRKCVSEAFHGMSQRKTIIVPTVKMRVAMAGQKLLPTKLLVSLTANQQKKKMDDK